MRKLIYTLAGATALASASMSNAAVTVSSASVVNLNNPNPATNVQVNPNNTTINFGLNPTPDSGDFTSMFDLTNGAAGVYTISGSTSTTGVTFTSGTFGAVGGVLGATLFPLVIGVGPDGLPDFGLAATELAAGTYRLTLNGSTTQAGTYTGNVTVTAAAVPEAATWAMMLIGFGAMGLTLRRRRQPALSQLA